MKRTKEQYLDLLRYYFRKAKSEDLQEILSDHEEHFLSGCEQGLSDEEIIKALGEPKEIYNEYLSEGIVTEKKGLLKGDLKEIMEQAQEEFNTIKPQIPTLIHHASKAVSLTSGVLAYLLAAVCWFITPLVGYLLSIQLQPFATIAPLPAISILTLLAFIVTGLFAGLIFFFIGKECMNIYRVKQEEQG